MTHQGTTGDPCPLDRCRARLLSVLAARRRRFVLDAFEWVAAWPETQALMRGLVEAGD